MNLYVVLQSYTIPDGPFTGVVDRLIFGPDDFGGEVYTSRTEADQRCAELLEANYRRTGREGADSPMTYQVAELKICA